MGPFSVVLRFGLAVTVALSALPSASAATCAAGAICVYDSDGDGEDDSIWAGKSIVSSNTHVNGTEADSSARAGLATADVDASATPKADGTPEEVFAGAVLITPVGSSYTVAYVQDQDQGDVVDYAYLSTANSALGHGAAVGVYVLDQSDALGIDRTGGWWLIG